MDYAITTCDNGSLSTYGVSSLNMAVLSFSHVYEHEHAPANIDYRYALTRSSWFDENYASIFEIRDSNSVEEKMFDVKALFLQTLLEVFPSLANRLLSLARAEDGWDGYEANSLSFESLGQFRRFILKADLFANDIGLYLDHCGSLILTYTNSDQELVDMTFHSHGIDVCSDDFEGVLSLEQAVKFVKS